MRQFNSMRFPKTVVQKAMVAAAADALQTFWDAERKVNAGDKKAATLHRAVLDANRLARRLAKEA